MKSQGKNAGNICVDICIFWVYMRMFFFLLTYICIGVYLYAMGKKADKHIQDKGYRRFAVILPDDLLIAAKVKAVQNHTSLSQVMRELLTGWVNQKVHNS